MTIVQRTVQNKFCVIISLMRTFDIHDLLDNRYPHACLHDSPIQQINVDYIQRDVAITCLLAVSNPDEDTPHETYAHGLLTFTGMKYFVVEAPDENYCYDDSKGLDIAAEGSLSSEEMIVKYPNLPRDLEDDDFVYYFYATNCNSMIFIAANDAHFIWL